MKVFQLHDNQSNKNLGAVRITMCEYSQKSEK
jgi:hypothetical protein